jgi:hypothetical protein
MTGNVMKTKMVLSTNKYPRPLLIVLAFALQGLMGCSTVGGTARQNHEDSNVMLAGRAYNSESRGFDRPWPFGPESSQQ